MELCDRGKAGHLLRVMGGPPVIQWSVSFVIVQVVQNLKDRRLARLQDKLNFKL